MMLEIFRNRVIYEYWSLLHEVGKEKRKGEWQWISQQNNLPPECVVNGTECYVSWVWTNYLVFFTSLRDPSFSQNGFHVIPKVLGNCNPGVVCLPRHTLSLPTCLLWLHGRAGTGRWCITGNGKHHLCTKLSFKRARQHALSIWKGKIH